MNELRHVPLFSLLDDDELAVLSAQVEMRSFAAKQRIYKAGEPSLTAYVMITGAVRVLMLDAEGQEVIFSEPRHGDIFGFASLLDEAPHRTTAYADEASTCLEIDRHDLQTLIAKKPMAGLDMMTVLAREIHAMQKIASERQAVSPNQIIDDSETTGERIADHVASFGGSWTFILCFIGFMMVYVSIQITMGGKAWDPYPFILLNLFLSMLAAIQAPVIMMSQNRQDAKDRTRSEMDFDVNRRAESQIHDLGRRLQFLTDKVDDLIDHVHKPSA